MEFFFLAIIEICFFGEVENILRKRENAGYQYVFKFFTFC